MNLREGSRRLALLLGVLGCVAGSVVAAAKADEQLSLYRRGREFTKALGEPMVKAAAAARKHQFEQDPYKPFQLPEGAQDVVEVHSGDVKQIVWHDGSADAPVDRLEMADGKTLFPIGLDQSSLLGIAFLPLLGFALPFGVVRGIAWVVMGFTKQL